MKAKSIKFAVMTIHEARNSLATKLEHVYDKNEAMNIAQIVIEHITGISSREWGLSRHHHLNDDMVSKSESVTGQLLTHKPVQYVFNEAWFAGLNLFVDENVLIPRPETEELVEWIVNDKNIASIFNGVVIDIGTGSGCIALAIKKKWPDAKVYATDVSEGALKVAQRNAWTHSADIHFMLSNVLSESEWQSFPVSDIIVSNPPYIPVSEKVTMHDNVVKYEPHVALFVDNDDPLLFYRAIGMMANKKLAPGGKLYLEVHENMSAHVKELFGSLGFSNVEIKKDMQHKERMMCIML